MRDHESIGRVGQIGTTQINTVAIAYIVDELLGIELGVELHGERPVFSAGVVLHELEPELGRETLLEVVLQDGDDELEGYLALQLVLAVEGVLLLVVLVGGLLGGHPVHPLVKLRLLLRLLFGDELLDFFLVPTHHGGVPLGDREQLLLLLLNEVYVPLLPFCGLGQQFLQCVLQH